MGQAVPTVHLTFYHLVVVARDRSDIYRCADHSFLPSPPEYTQCILPSLKWQKAYDLNLYEYLKFLLDHRPNENMSDEELEQLAP